MFTIYASNYAPINPLVPPCDINLIPIGYVGENLARCLVFDLSECVEQFGDGGFVISFMRHGDELPYLVTNTDRLEDNAIWNITDTDTAVDGYGLVQLQYIVDEVVCKSALYRTVTFESNGITGDVPDPYEDLLAQIAAYASTAQSSAAAAVAAAAAASTAVDNGIKAERSQRLAADASLNEKIDLLQAAVGAPLTVTQASAMTDINKVYVYTGSETGYTFGNWYYYNGAEWVSGGIYNSEGTNIDDSLTMAGFAADAMAAGDRINAAFVVEETSGSIASFADGADGVPLKDLVVNISPVQSGTGDPSPSNVRAISGYTSVTVTRAGKNLLNVIATGSASSGGMTYTVNDDKTVDVSGTRTGTSYRQIGTFIGVNGVTYKFTGVPDEIADNPGPARLYLARGTTTIYATHAGATFTYLDSMGTLGVVIRTDSQISETIRFKPMVRLASVTDSTYEPYTADTYPISLSSAGTVYGGTLDVTSGMLTVTKAFISNAEWAQFNQNNGYKAYRVFHAPNSAYEISEMSRNEPMSNMVTAFGSFSSSSMNQNKIQLPLPNDANGTLYMALDENVDPATVQIVYLMKNPISYQLTPTEVRTLLANNSIWSDTGSVESCEYRADTRLYIEKLTTPDNDMVANANITSGSYFMVNNNLYLATSAIASGATIVPGTNCTATNLAAALNAINA